MTLRRQQLPSVQYTRSRKRMFLYICIVASGRRNRYENRIDRSEVAARDCVSGDIVVSKEKGGTCWRWENQGRRAVSSKLSK